MQRVKLAVIMACMIATFGCKKEITTLPQNRQTGGSSGGEPSYSQEKELVSNIAKFTEVLKVMYADNSNLKVVNASIFAHAYTDESIMVRDLIYPEQSRLTGNVRFKSFMQKWNLSLEKFAANFWKEVSKTNDENFKRFLTGLGGATSAAARTDAELTELTIYFPDSEGREQESENGHYAPITTLVAATEDADKGIGYQPYYVAGEFQYYREVIVDDEYAENNPTQIVGLNGVEPYDGAVSLNSAFPPSLPIDLPGLIREVKQVYVGDIRINNHQFDKLISFTGNGGGSEIRFTRADGFLKVEDGQVQTADVYFTSAKDVSRKDIRNKIWVAVSSEWDGDWEDNNLQENLAMYEEDNRNNSTFNGSLSTTITASLTPINVTATRSLGFSINFKSDDELIRQINFNRDVFFILNRTNLEGEMHDGWPVRDIHGSVSYTLNDRTYY